MSCPTFICNFFCSLKCPLCWFAGMKMSTMVPCTVSASSTESTLPGPAMQLSSSCCLSFCTFLFYTSFGVNNNNHPCSVFLLLFCKELFGAFFERHTQRNNDFEKCTRDYLLCLEPFHHCYQPTHQ